ncbi:tudor domain-containing protein 7 isoform X1 [Diorhabda carinulata]|uniref:tudor domain-containing protein 7 isoform X1 n=1 Tax=Diorhabda carinulata TaxID=1163345 RepID=UPI0025A02568|nr:tudor domain-containing protein 7 isoform X1 [Diorhabda carinulata]XP_057667391.1 tudor domain-containing protein 7 isoform X1 [Diorhabda carinulata]XP_057667392.1 tudor domain-containing protein 7 isoform X1 [Diorhabda carinulata]XP_057667393.1 tudor domain-containing protein 7 isoform X1 [Diorhabda carinulata]
MDQKVIVKRLRGLIVASKYPMTLKQLENDYRLIMGEGIPFRDVGYKSLEEFLKSAQTLKVFRNNKGDIVVDAETSAQSAHIVEMVQKQKTPKRPPRRVHFTQKAYAPTIWRPKHSSKSKKKYTASSRLVTVSHNQFVNNLQPAKSVASKLVIPELSNFSNTNNDRLPPRLQKLVNVNGRAKAQQSLQMRENGMKNTHKEIVKSLSEETCSPGVSRRKKITKLMSEISLERDSGNSSPVGDIVPITFQPILPSKTPDFVCTGDIKTDLKNFVEFHKLGEIDVSVKNISKKINIFTCKIKIGNHQFTSYPEEFKNSHDAEMYCYKQAFKELTEKYGKRKSLFLASDKDILERIPKMLEKHTGGLWEWQVRQDYTEKYNEQLPADWLKIIDSSPCIHVQKVVNTYTLKHCKPEEVLQKGQMWMKSMTLTDVSVPSNTIELNDGQLYAEVTFLLSANEIWCRQAATEASENYINMVSKLEEYYNNNKESLRAPVVNRNGYYVASYEYGWYRVRAVEVDEKTVLCFYIDFGDEIVLPIDKIYQLKREFAVCQAQAFVCRLAGLEDLYEVSVGSAILQSLLYKNVVLEVASDTIATDENDVSLPVYMYDMETGVCLNKELIPKLTLESAAPNILSDTITEVYISNIAANGDIYIQIRSPGYETLLQLLSNLENQIVSNPPTDIMLPLTKSTSADKIYMGKHKMSGHWYRVKIIDWSPKEDMAQIYYIDYGTTDVIKVKETALYPLEKLDDIVNMYPPQAVKTRMLLDDIPTDFLAAAKKVLPIEESIIIKLIKYNSENVPLVEFFRRTTEGGLFCINKSIIMENEIKRSDAKSNRKIPNGEVPCKNVPSTGKLKCPPLPEINETFEVHVPFAVNPYNFFIQPLESRPKLHKMMQQLQERYKEVLYSPLTIDQITPGNIYASKFDDGNWYRTSVIKVINDGSISVFYCDFGYYANLTVQQLIPLDVEYLELPYQALKARLSDIRPKDSNWTMEHCDEFKEMVERKHFYSFLLNISKDELYDSDLVLDLLLIDTSSEEEDIYIGTELINRGIAVEGEKGK